MPRPLTPTLSPAAEETIHRFERRYGIASQQFFELYSAGKLDDGEHAQDFSEWAGFYRLKLRREQALKDLSQERLRQLEATAPSGRIPLDPQESLVDASSRVPDEARVHPNDPTLAATFPHHKHEPPDIKHNRSPAPSISFDSPNLPKLIAEIGELS